MPEKPTLLYLHGVGDGDPDQDWKAALERSLTRLGYPNLSETNVIAPKYAYALKGVDDVEELPDVQVKDLRGDEKKQHRRDFQRRRTAMEVRLGRDSPGDGWPVPEPVKGLVMKMVKQANNYVTTSEIRAAVLRRVLRDLPESGQIVIVGHSLGSVVAADVLRRLPSDLDVVGMVTIGSPLGHDLLRVKPLAELLETPPPNLGWWVNFRNTTDPVAAGRGVSAEFPWVLEQRLSEFNAAQAHFSSVYLSSPMIAKAVGYGLFGSQTTALATVEKGLDIPLDYAETVAVLALRYAHQTMRYMKGDVRGRYAEALRQAQMRTVDQIKARNAAVGRPLAGPIARLAFDLADPAAEAPEPETPTHLDQEEAMLPLLAIAQINPLAPFEIDVDMDDRRRAMRQVTLEMKLGREFGDDVFDALDSAGDVLKGPTSWVRWVALGIGAAAIVAATGGLAMAAAPGVAGAAAVTSALAAFGPGGMIGGLLTAGTLMTAGGSGLAVGLVNPETSVDAVTAVLEARLAMSILREKHHYEPDPQMWYDLVNIEIEIQRDLARLESVSDRSAHSIKQLKRKREAVDKVLDYLEERGLAPLV